MWSLDGLDRLNGNGRFTLPPSSADMANLMADLASPVSAFVRDRCVRRSDATFSVTTCTPRGRMGRGEWSPRRSEVHVRS